MQEQQGKNNTTIKTYYIQEKLKAFKKIMAPK